MWQAKHVQARLNALYPERIIEILGITTRGDRILDRTLSKVGGKGLFTKELELAITEGHADLAVHSLKDIPMELPLGFMLGAVMEREDPRDAFISNHYTSLEQLPVGAIIGTSSLRRQAFISAKFPFVKISPLRGNLNTRLSKLDQGKYDAIILAAVGLKRLNLEKRITAFIEPEQILPAPGQGAIAIEILSRRTDLQEVLRPLNHRPTELRVTAERVLSSFFGGSCQIPLAAFATITSEHQMYLRAMITTPDGKEIVGASANGSKSNPEDLGKTTALELEKRGARKILRRCRKESSKNKGDVPKIIITSPIQQATVLAHSINVDNYQTVVFPLLKISPLEDSSLLQAKLRRLNSFSLVIFISPNAIDTAFQYILKWPPNLPIGIVGEGSRTALAQHGLNVQNTAIFCPLDKCKSGSQGLLKELNLSFFYEKKVLLVCGEKGQESLIDSFITAHIDIEVISAYRRQPPLLDSKLVSQIQLFLDSKNAWVITSSESIKYLAGLVRAIGGNKKLVKIQSQKIFTPHNRIVEIAQAIGFRDVTLIDLRNGKFSDQLEFFLQ